ncbi:MAG: hypothetical protein KIS79_08825 [Burkholderiales bacterium]|nr:hypothetical protein [Burkholderiales bacterium]
MKRSLAVVVGLGTLFAMAPAVAGKVNLPKEGNFEFLFCLVGQEASISVPDKVYVSQYKSIANTLTQPAGKAFDRMSALCYGTYANLSGRHQEVGVCEMTDQDGDKWWMEYTVNADGSGGPTSAAYGTGKYEGMTLKGQYTNNPWPSAEKDGFQYCNPNKGTYKLK